MVDLHHHPLTALHDSNPNTRVATIRLMESHFATLRIARPPALSRDVRPAAVAAAAAVQDAYVKYSRSCRWRCTALKWPPPESELEIDECVSQLSSSSLKFDM